MYLGKILGRGSFCPLLHHPWAVPERSILDRIKVLESTSKSMFYQRNTNGVNQIGQKENLLKLKTNVLKLIEKFRSPHAFSRSLLNSNGRLNICEVILPVSYFYLIVVSKEGIVLAVSLISLAEIWKKIKVPERMFKGKNLLNTVCMLIYITQDCLLGNFSNQLEISNVKPNKNSATKAAIVSYSEKELPWKFCEIPWMTLTIHKL